MEHGEERVEITIVGEITDHYFEGCDEKGFYIGAEEKEPGIYTFNIACGRKPEGQTKIFIIKERGI